MERTAGLFGAELPIIQAPMAGATTPEMVIAVCEAGGIGSLPCAMLSPDALRSAVARIRSATRRPLNLNFFAHRMPAPDEQAEASWRRVLAPYNAEFCVATEAATSAASRAPFDGTYCTIVEDLRPDIVSFHFGLPEPDLLARVRGTGAAIIASATTVAEARHLDSHGVDAVIAMGWEAGGHRGNFLTDDMSAQPGTMALVPQVVDAVRVPVIAAGGIADARGVRAALALGAAAVQVGTAYLFCPEAAIPAWHRAALHAARDDATAVTNLFTGRPARGLINRLMQELGPMRDGIPAFPLAGIALAPLRRATEAQGLGEFSNMWAGQSAPLGRAMPAGDLTRFLAGQDVAVQKTR